MSKTAVVILNWNGRSYLERFLPEVITNTTTPDTEVIIADNGSTDDSVTFLRTTFPQIKVIELGQNYGYAGGYNHALALIDAEYFILLNSDVSVGAGWTDPLIMFMDLHPMAGACQPKIRAFNENSFFEYAGAAGGFIDRYGYPFCRGRIFNTIEEDKGQYEEITEVFWASGACMMVRSSAFRTCGGFDDSFFAHMEEIDLCWRMQNAGFTIYYLPDPVVYHVGGGTLSYNSPYKTYLNFRNSLMTLAKNLPRRQVRKTILIRMILDGIAAISFLFSTGIDSFKAVIKAHRDFRKERDIIITKRTIAPPHDTYWPPHTMLNRSIVSEYYLKKKKYFEDLDWKIRR